MAWVVNSTFDPYTQDINLLAPDGVTPYTVSLSYQATLQQIVVIQGIEYGVQFGMSIMLLVVLLVTTKRDKRRRAVFLLNALAILLSVLRNLIATIAMTDMFSNYYNWQFGWYPDNDQLHRAQALSSIDEILNVLLDMAVYASLTLQVHVICCTMKPLHKNIALGACCLLAVATTIERIVLAAYNIKYSILGANTYNLEQIDLVSRLARVNNALSVTTISFFSLIFNIRLLIAIIARRKLGLTQFGPMQIIFIMGCQTLILPLIFAILAYYALPTGAQLNSFVMTLVAVFLPLSGIWAAANGDDSKPKNDNMHRRLVPYLPKTDDAINSMKENKTMMTGFSDNTLVEHTLLKSADKQSTIAKGDPMASISEVSQPSPKGAQNPHAWSSC